jgi:hypothetical protein
MLRVMLLMDAAHAVCKGGTRFVIAQTLLLFPGMTAAAGMADTFRGVLMRLLKIENVLMLALRGWLT